MNILHTNPGRGDSDDSFAFFFERTTTRNLKKFEEFEKTKNLNSYEYEYTQRKQE